MKICIIGSRGFPGIQGGVEKHCEALYTSMCSQHNNIEITVFRRKPYITLSPSYKNIHFIDLPSTKIKGFETVIHSFFATCVAITQSPQIIHFHNIGPAMFSPLAKLFGIKVILTFHSANYEHKKWGKFAKLLLKGSEKIALSQADKVLKIGNKKYILAVGRISPEKGFDLLIKAFSQINTDYKLVIAGGVETETGYFKKLQDMIPPLRIIFTGYATGDNLKQLYSNAALFVLPSRNEGFPIVLLEAMAYQLDVLVSDIPATHLVDLQEKDYFKLDDENSLIKGISDKLQNITSRKYDLTNFNWDKIALKVYDIYHNI